MRFFSTPVEEDLAHKIPVILENGETGKGNLLKTRMESLGDSHQTPDRHSHGEPLNDLYV